MMKGEKPLVMMVKVVIARVIIVATTIVVTVEIVGTIKAMILIVKRAVAKTIIAKIVAMIGENP